MEIIRGRKEGTDRLPLFSDSDLPRKQRPFRRGGHQYSLVSLSSSASENTGPSLQTYFPPTLQRPHFITNLFTPGGTNANNGEFAGMNDFEVVAYFAVIPETGQDKRKD